MEAAAALDRLRHRETLADLVVSELRQRIVSGGLPMGAELNQLALTEELGVSRAVVREAFRQLEAAGMIRLSPYHHAVVTPLAESDLDDLLRVRATIEGVAVRRVSLDLDEAGFEGLAAHLELLEGEADPGAWLRLDQGFHLAVCDATRNPLLRNLLDAVRLPVDRYMQLLAGVGPRMAPANQEHRAIFEAMRRRDPRLAQSLMRRHVEATGRMLRQRLRGVRPAERVGRGEVR